MTHIKAILTAYSDCNGFTGERDLNFVCDKALTADELRTVFPAAVPDGYNEFDPNLSVAAVIGVFGADAKYYVAREGSVCIYIMPTTNLWLNRGNAFEDLADEVSWCPRRKMFRVWWD